MNSFISSTKTTAKKIRWRARRRKTAQRWGADQLAAMPAVLGNAMPKSGSHLISQVLHGLTQLGPFVDPGFPPVTRSQANKNLTDAQVLANLSTMQPGDLAYGYVQARAPFVEALTAEGRATIFVYRDPRDVIVSHVFYATDMYTGHGMHKYYTEHLSTMEERINAAIEGVTVPGFELSPILAKYKKYLAWLDHPTVLSMRFEDLILDREVALSRILDYLGIRGFTHQPPRDEAIAILKEAIAPQKSGTFRKGKPGNWQEHFTPDNIARMKAATGDLLVRLNYEENTAW